MRGLRNWVERETKLGIPALEQELERNPDPDLKKVYQWSVEVNETIKKIVRNLPPFPFLRESLEKMQDRADVIVVSQTPFEALDREWKEHGINSLVRLIAGQELGTKSEHLGFAAGGRYGAEKSLMIGDAPGDMRAAKNNHMLFYPITPGEEEAAWERFFHEALDRFYNGTYQGDYERELIKEFNTHLPENPPWRQED